jgi:hypothetical protein
MNPQFHVDPHALDKLHDFQQPAPPSWMPQTAAWYVLFAIIVIALAWIAYRSIRRWQRNRYRRAALLELATTAPANFSALLKRTALAAWPREQIAALNGGAWLDFLNHASSDAWFTTEPGNRVEDLAVSDAALSSADQQKLREIVARWIRRHRVSV